MSTLSYNYGDGSLNTASLGYENILRCNGKTVSYGLQNYHNNSANYRFKTAQGYSYTSAEIYPDIALWKETERLKGGSASITDTFPEGSYDFLDNKGTLLYKQTTGLSGTNTFTFLTPVKDEKTIYLWLSYGSYTTGIYISSLKFTVDGQDLTLKQMVDNGICKPLIILSSFTANGNYYFPNALNLYSGGQTDSGNYPDLRVIFMLNEGHTVTGFSYYASTAGNSTYKDGVNIAMSFDINDLRFTIEE